MILPINRKLGLKISKEMNIFMGELVHELFANLPIKGTGGTQNIPILSEFGRALLILLYW